MKIQGSRFLAMVTFLVLAGVATDGGVSASAQFIYDNYYPPTPPQGPPLASGNNFITVDTFITPEVHGRIDQAMSDNNNCYWLAKAGAASCIRDEGIDDNDKCIWGCTKNGAFIPRPTSGAFITASKQRYSPSLTQTLYADRPNDNVAQVKYFVIYNLTQIWSCKGGICYDYPFSRTISQSIDLYFGCQGWQTGTGTLSVTTVVARAYMDPDHSVIEDALFGILWNNVIPNYVDSKIRSALSSFGAGTSSKPIGTTDANGVFTPKLCNRLGVSSFADAPSLETINFEKAFVLAPMLAQQITVRVTQVRRLMVHDSSGNIVYYATEYPQLELYAGYSKLVLTLPPMLEGQAYFPTATAFISTPVPPSSGRLILIATMWNLATYTRDPMFAIFDKNSNWGAGTRALNTPKIWSQFSTIIKKPLLMRANGYEVTVQITTPPTSFISFKSSTN